MAPSASCPSRNTVAATVTCSPTAAFAGRRPHSMSGVTSTIGIRSKFIARAGVAADATVGSGWLVADGGAGLLVVLVGGLAAAFFADVRARDPLAARLAGPPGGISFALIDPKLSGRGGLPRGLWRFADDLLRSYASPYPGKSPGYRAPRGRRTGWVRSSA